MKQYYFNTNAIRPGTIGEKLYLTDGSYAYKVRKGKRERILPFMASTDNEPKLVEIISQPFKRKIKVSHLYPLFKEYEFVKVLFEGVEYVVLNRFCPTFIIWRIGFD